MKTKKKKKPIKKAKKLKFIHQDVCKCVYIELPNGEIYYIDWSIPNDKTYVSTWQKGDFREAEMLRSKK